MKFLIPIGFCLLTFSVFSQNTTISFQKSYGGSLYEDGIDVISLPNGDFVVCGASFSDISGDKTTNSFGRFDYWIFQITATGSMVWQTTIGGNQDDIPSEIIQTSDGGFIITGTTYSSISGNKNSANYGQNDAWVVKLSSTGQLQWEKSYGGTSFDAGVGIISLPNGNYFLANSSGSGKNGNKSESSNGGDDYWCVIIDINGNILNQFVYGGSGNDRLRDAVLINSNQVLLTGISNSDISGDKNENSFGNFDFWMLISDLNGNAILSSTEGGDEYDISINAVVNLDKSIRVFGNSDSNPSGSKTSSNYGYNDYWVVALDSNLNKVGESSFGGSSGDQGLPGRVGVYYSGTNEYVIAGESTSSISGNKLEPSFNIMSGDIWVVGMDNSGSKTFEFVAGGTEGDQPRSIIETTNNTVCIIGTSSSGISGNKTEHSNGKTDVWLFELDFNLSIDNIIHEPGLTSYPNPATTVLNFALPMVVKKSKVTLTDISGRVVFEGNTSGLRESKIDVSSFTCGIYVLSIISDKFQYTRKIVIE